MYVLTLDFIVCIITECKLPHKGS